MPKKAALSQDEPFCWFLGHRWVELCPVSKTGLAIDDCLMDNLSAGTSGDQNRGSTLVIVIWVLTGLALIVVSIKIYTRIKIIREPALDDFFTMLAVV